MNEQTHNDLQPLPEQLIYANMLFTGVWVGIVILLITYFLYVSGILTAHVDIATIPLHWGKGVHEYMELTNSPQGWNWAYLLHRGDFLNFFGLALLGLMTVFCYMVLVVGYFKRKNWILFWICVAEILVLSVAASGILGSGGH